MQRMQYKINTSLLLFFSLVYSLVSGQKKTDLQGYVSLAGSTTQSELLPKNMNEGMINNRLNFSWYPNDKLTFNFQARNRFIYDNKNSIINYHDGLEKDNAWVDLSWNLLNGNDAALNINIDRAYLEFTQSKVTVTLGRQRINWGRTLAFNVNDIFNTYSFFELDYAERPGSDAVRVQYFTSYTSAVELAAKVDSSGKVTAALLNRMSLFNYDVQMLAGIYNEQDYVLGLGWEGNIKSMGFKGEATYLHPYENKEILDESFLFSTSLDYTLPNSLYLYGEYLYNSAANPNAGAIMNIAAPAADIRNISFDKHSVLAQVSYPINPLLNGSLSVMYLPGINAFYTGPTLGLSLKDNLELSGTYQYFTADVAEVDLKMHVGFLRLKWHF